MTDDERIAEIIDSAEFREWLLEKPHEVRLLLDAVRAENERADSIQLALDAERYTHLRDNEYLLQQRDAANATLARVQKLPGEWDSVVSRSAAGPEYNAGVEFGLASSATDLRRALDGEEGK